MDQAGGLKDDSMDGLNSLGWKIHDHLKHHRPKMFRALKQEGRLNQHCLDLQTRGNERLTALEHQGLYPHEAMEIVGPELFPPCEEDLPDLGGTIQPYAD